MNNFIKYYWGFFILVPIFFLSIKGCNQTTNLEKENKVLSEKAKTNKDFGQYYLDMSNAKDDQIRFLKKEIESLNKSVNKKQIVLKAAQKQTIKPIYIPQLQPCNDSLQLVYAKSVLKDSLCNGVIAGKDSIIDKNAKVISLQDYQKLHLLSAIEKNQLAIAVQDTIIFNDKKIIKNEKSKKTFWKLTTVGLGIVILKLLLIK